MGLCNFFSIASRFSALQRAENSSTASCCPRHSRISRVSVLFSEPKIPQHDDGVIALALAVWFQCSSASRKFLNQPETPPTLAGFLFQCSSASRKFLNVRRNRYAHRRFYVSVLFSEPKIPQPKDDALRLITESVSVLFSEPKIPQPPETDCRNSSRGCFSALQRAENSSTAQLSAAEEFVQSFSALQRAENSSTIKSAPRRCIRSCFSALQRAENSSTGRGRCERFRTSRSFSALQRAENSSTLPRT